MHSHCTISMGSHKASLPVSLITADACPLRRASTCQNESLLSIDFSSASGVTASLIMKAAQSGATTQVEVQIKRGVNVEACHDKTDRTTLAVMAHCSKSETANLLLENSTDINVKDFSAMTPLHLAASRGHMSVLYIFLGDNVDVNIMDKQRRSAFWITADDQYIDAARLLLNYNSKINLRAATPYILQPGVSSSPSSSFCCGKT